eukprot:jgi/Galph1/1996/GphlegSOOS_G693.1
MSESYVSHIGRLVVTHIVRAQVEEELGKRPKPKTTSEQAHEVAKAEPAVPFVKSSFIEVLEEVTANLIFQFGKLAHEYSLVSNNSNGTVMDVLDALKDYSTLFYVSPGDLLLYMSFEEIIITSLPNYFAKSIRKISVLGTDQSHEPQIDSSQQIMELRWTKCYEEWMPSFPPASTLIMDQEKKASCCVDQSKKSTGQLFMSMRYGLLAQSRNASLQNNPFLKIPHKSEAKAL